MAQQPMGNKMKSALFTSALVIFRQEAVPIKKILPPGIKVVLLF